MAWYSRWIDTNVSAFLVRTLRSRLPAVKASPIGSLATQPSRRRVVDVWNSSNILLYESVGICGRRRTCCTTSPQWDTISIQYDTGLTDSSSGDRGMLFNKFWKYGTVA